MKPRIKLLLVFVLITLGLSFVRWILKGHLGTPEPIALVSLLCFVAGTIASKFCGVRAAILVGVVGSLFSDIFIANYSWDYLRVSWSQASEMWLYLEMMILVTAVSGGVGGLAGGVLMILLRQTSVGLRAALGWTEVVLAISWVIWFQGQDNTDYARSYALSHFQQGYWDQAQFDAFVAQAEGMDALFIAIVLGVWAVGLILCFGLTRLSLRFAKLSLLG